MAEVSHILLDAGAILIVTAVEVTKDDLEIIKTVVDNDRIISIWIGENATTDLNCDLNLPPSETTEKAALIIKSLLQDRGLFLGRGSFRVGLNCLKNESLSPG